MSSLTDNSLEESVVTGTWTDARSSGSELSSSVNVIRRAHSDLPAFSKLSENADLNCPPPNWLRSDNPVSFIHHLNKSPNVNFTHTRSTDGDEETGHIEPSSVTLASHYPKAVGHMDVVADAKNIKKLLKLPYSNSLVSLTIHRAGKKTLLIDDFNAPLQLNRVASSNLDRLFRDNPALNPSRHAPVHPRKKDPENTRHRNMLSKLLYYSAQEDSNKAVVHAPLACGSPSDELSISDHVTSSQEYQVTTETASDDSTVLEDESNKTTAQDMLELVKVKQPFNPEHAVSLSSSEDLNSSPVIPQSPLSQPLLGTVSLLQNSSVGAATSSLIQRSKLSDAVCSSDAAATTERGQEEVFPNQPSHVSPQPFYQNVQWIVKDTSMLLGSDLPIFGVDGHPAISLRLRDKMKPVTVLTGMEYWLDNLMCNVPELAMCFHVDGILQNYHIVKTEDIPKLDESCRFSPEEVLDVIHSILGFLKANCTREGHTYWLFRKKGEDVVKLYDLTSLNCFKGDGNEDHNPFAKSVATLFYRVAHNMLNGEEELSSEELAMAKLLLENCIKLIAHWDKEICLSAYYLLADLFLNKAPLHSEPTPPESRDNSSCSEAETVGQESTDGKIMQSVISQSLSVSLLRESRHGLPNAPELPPIPLLVVNSSLDRARLALEQVSSAMLSLDVNGPIVPGKPPPWELLGMSKLLAQAGSAYFLLADVSLDQNKLGRALRYGKYSILCSRASSKFQERADPVSTVEKLNGSEDTLCRAWQLCGDIHCLSTKLSDSFSANLEDFQSMNPEDSTITKLAQSVLDFSGGFDEKEVLCLSLHTELETSLLRSVDCYQLAASLSQPSPPHPLEERLGNAWNELGVYYLRVAASMDFSKEPKHVEKLWKSSYSCISDGLECFKKTGSLVNQALLSANLGKLMCSCAQAHGLKQSSDDNEQSLKEFNQQEKLYYSKSVEYYLTAKQTLRRRSTHPGIWTNVIVDLSSVCLTMGTAMLRHPPLSYLTQQEVSQEVSNMLNKALCNIEPELTSLDKDHPRYSELCRVTGDCHNRLGDLHHQNSLSTSLTPQKLKQLRTLAEKHYNRALVVYQVEFHFCELLELQLNYARYFEHHAQGKGRLKGLQSSLSCLIKTVEPIRALTSQPSQPAPPGSTIHSLSHSLMKQLVEVLKQLLITSKKRSETSVVVPTYKQMYGEILLKSQQIQSRNELTNKQVHVVLETLTQLDQYNRNITL